MKKYLCGTKVSAFNFIFNLIWQSIEHLTIYLTAVRAFALLLIIALLMPVFLFNPNWQISAQTNLPIQPPSVVSEPPMLFNIESSGFNAESFVLAANSSVARVSNFFTTPQLPAGFENAKPVSPFSDYFASISPSLELIFGFFLPNLTSKPDKISETVVNNSSNMMFGQFSVGVDFDFDDDDKADIARWNPSSGEWKVKNSSNGNYITYSLGSSSTQITPGDFDGDYKTDFAVFNSGTWTIRKSGTNTTQTISFGTSGDKPVVGDYDGDGRSDCAVFRPSTNVWWILYSANGVCGGSYTSATFGTSDDITAQGKFDGDNKTDIAIFRPSTGDWHIQGSTAGYYIFHWGISSDIPVPADYDGDGKSDCAVYRSSTGTWYAYKSSTNNGSYLSQVWGNYGDQPVPADYDGDSKADFSVWRPTTGVWHTIKSSNSTYDYQTLGINGEKPVSSAYLKQIGAHLFGYDMAKIRLSPKNSTGGTNLYSRNFGWGTGIVGLPGRAGLGAGFGISYNSLIWTKDTTNSTIVFDADMSNVSPGFRFGFPTIEPMYYNTQTSKLSFLMVSPSGTRTEFRQTGASNIYETADSSYTQIEDTTGGDIDTPPEEFSLVIKTTDGTKMSYVWKGGAYRCTKITDRNGNYIDINHDEQGLLRTITDTLGRVITVNYDSGLYPTSITQTWKDSNGSGSNVTHTWATFTYTSQTIDTNFSGSTVVGPPDDTSLKVLQKITFPNSSYTTFEYNSWGQVKQINNYAADAHRVNYVKVNLPTDASSSQTDCPRFTETRSWIENFNLDQYGTAQETVINNSITESQTYSLPGNITGSATLIKAWMTNHPDNLISKTYVGSSGWTESLPIATEECISTNCIGTDRKRWTWTNRTQDDTSKSYIVNPRVTETKVGDTSNTKRATTEYYPVSTGSPVALYGLVKEIKVYDTDQSTVLKKLVTEYNTGTAYTSRRIIGLPSKSESYGLETTGLNLMSKITYEYDEGNFSDSTLSQNISPIQHDNTNYGSSFVTGRGNLTSTKRWDITASTNTNLAITSSVKYNTAGAVVSQISPWTSSSTREVKISYADKFNDGNDSRNTYAYPTRVTDPAGNYSEVKYRFDMGANVWAISPTPEGPATDPNEQGKETTRIYDSVGRLEKETLVNNGAYTRYEYPTNGVQAKVYSTLIDVDGDSNLAEDEVFSESWTDGAGRVRKSRTEHPGSDGEWSGSLVEYDALGRVKRSTVPTEINSSYEPAGDDYTRGFLWTQQEYDWKGRVTRIINSDSNGTDGKDQLFSYEGCGCAGGQVTTIQGELVPRNDQPNTNARRTQKIYEDILGRTYKTEIMEWNGTTVYMTTVRTFNGRDQVTKTRQYAGTTSSSTYQDLTMSYDGHGRMATRHYPIEDSNANTSWIYNADDSILQITDPRGVMTNFTYNNRGLVTQISYDVPTNQTSTVPDTPNVTFTYDAVGNRTEMVDGTGTTDYEYDELSRLTKETKSFTSLTGESFPISYTYHIGGALKSITDSFNSTVNYTNDKTSRVTAVAGNTTTSYADNIKYRAFGGIKQMDYTLLDDTPQIKLGYDNRLRVNHSELTTENNQSGYLMKADFSYFADSRVQAKDDLLDNKWDRTMKYDFAGRLTFNQFGMGVGSNNQQKRVYEQTIQYDAFSQMTSRIGVHWDNGITFGESYVNGRIQNFSGTYDAAGNIVYAVTETNSFQQTTFDAAGRRTVFFDKIQGRLGGILNMIQERKDEYFFDGDGRPVIDERGVRSYHFTNTNPAAMESSIYSYQVWSTVLGSSLTEITSSGDKLATKVFAGGAVIATEAGGANWRTSDPVTGTTGVLSEGGNFSTEEIEPLGQKVRIDDPADPPEPTFDNRLGSADDPQWQCEAGETFWGGFDGLPWHCKWATKDSPSWRVVLLSSNPKKVIESIDSPIPDTDVQDSVSDETLSYVQNITAKGQNEESGPCPKGQKKIRGKCRKIKKEKPLATLNIKVPPINVEPPDDWTITGHPISLFDTEGINYLRKIFPLIQLFAKRVEFIGFDKQQEEFLFNRLLWMMLSKSCYNAFKAAGLPSIGERIRDFGLTVANSFLLEDEGNNIKLGITPGERVAALFWHNSWRGVLAFANNTPLKSGRFMMFVRPTSWREENANELGNSVIHETVHVSGQPAIQGSKGQHDLSYMGENYQRIIENCKPPGEQ